MDPRIRSATQKARGTDPETQIRQLGEWLAQQAATEDQKGAQYGGPKMSKKKWAEEYERAKRKAVVAGLIEQRRSRG